jgi:hypothetical protein
MLFRKLPSLIITTHTHTIVSSKSISSIYICATIRFKKIIWLLFFIAVTISYLLWMILIEYTALGPWMYITESPFTFTSIKDIIEPLYNISFN